MSNRSLLARLALGAALVMTAMPGLAPSAGAADGAITASGPLADLSTATSDATDGAQARFWAVPDGDGTTAVLVLTGLKAPTGTTFGSHVHTKECIAGNPGATGPHFNIGGPADAQHEVWLDFTVRPGGVAVSRTSVPFVIPAGGANSVVIHASPTQVGGSAGPKIACLPVSF